MKIEDFLKSTYVKYFLIIISILVVTIYSINFKAVWWDESVYIGIGKYIGSFGLLGFFEIFRPPLLPLIYSILFKIGIPLYIFGKIFAIIFSVYSIYLVYVLSEQVKKGSGFFSGFFILINPVFLSNSVLVLTDIVSSVFILLSFLFFIKKKYFITGLFIAISCLFRFPQGLVVVPFLLFIIWDLYERDLWSWFKNIFKISLKISLGSLVLIFPYLVSNYYLYGNCFKPLIDGSAFASLDNFVFSRYLYDLGPFFYFKDIFDRAPFLFISSLFPIIFLFNKKFNINKLNGDSLRLIRLVTLSGLIFLIYFSIQPHKETRYAISFIYHFSILSGITFYLILSLFKNKKYKIIFVSIFVLIFIVFAFRLKLESYKNLVNFYDSLREINGTYISTTPVPVVFSDVKISELFDTRDTLVDVLKRKNDIIDGIVISSCDIFCKEKEFEGECKDDLSVIENNIKNNSYILSYEEIINNCKYSIYKK